MNKPEDIARRFKSSDVHLGAAASRRPHDSDALPQCEWNRSVGTATVCDDDLLFSRESLETSNGLYDMSFFVEGGNDDANAHIILRKRSDATFPKEDGV